MTFGNRASTIFRNLAVAVALVFASGALAWASTIKYGIAGVFEDAASTGAAQDFTALEGGSFLLRYELATGTLPGSPGQVISFLDFELLTMTKTGKVVHEFLSGRDFGALFMSPAPVGGTAGTFVFALSSDDTRFQIDIPENFEGWGILTRDAIFRPADASNGRLQIAGAVAFIPLPAPILLLLSGFGLIAVVRLPRRRRLLAARA